MTHRAIRLSTPLPVCDRPEECPGCSEIMKVKTQQRGRKCKPDALNLEVCTGVIIWVFGRLLFYFWDFILVCHILPHFPFSVYACVSLVNHSCLCFTLTFYTMSPVSPVSVSWTFPFLPFLCLQFGFWTLYISLLKGTQKIFK